MFKNKFHLSQTPSEALRPLSELELMKGGIPSWWLTNFISFALSFPFDLSSFSPSPLHSSCFFPWDLPSNKTSSTPLVYLFPWYHNRLPNPPAGTRSCSVRFPLRTPRTRLLGCRRARGALGEATKSERRRFHYLILVVVLACLRWRWTATGCSLNNWGNRALEFVCLSWISSGIICPGQ